MCHFGSVHPVLEMTAHLCVWTGQIGNEMSEHSAGKQPSF